MMTKKGPRTLLVLPCICLSYFLRGGGCLHVLMASLPPSLFISSPWHGAASVHQGTLGAGIMGARQTCSPTTEKHPPSSRKLRAPPGPITAPVEETLPQLHDLH